MEKKTTLLIALCMFLVTVPSASAETGAGAEASGLLDASISTDGDLGMQEPASPSSEEDEGLQKVCLDANSPHYDGEICITFFPKEEEVALDIRYFFGPDDDDDDEPNHRPCNPHC